MKTVRKSIPLSETRQFPQLFLDYVNGKKELRPFYAYAPALSSFQGAIRDLSAHSFQRNLLVNVITEQYAGTKNADLPSTLSLLLKPGSFTVTTGHQLCLFTGPLYFIYKIISAIRLAEALKNEYPQHDFIPVYWMASEDHDAAEVDHVHLFGKTLKWESGQAGAVGRFETGSLSTLLAQLKGMLGEGAHADELLGIFHNAYAQNNDLAHATRSLVSQLFAGSGLVVIDGNDKRLKKEFAPLMLEDVFQQRNAAWVSETISALKVLGYEAQVNPREINVFRLGKNARTRIEKAEEELRNELEQHPESFSPNVVLRPLYQQFLLPNIAYVGGPGELSYWLEYKRMFDHHKIFFPVLIPRNSVLWMDARQAEQQEKFGLQDQDLFRDTEELLKEQAKKAAGDDLSLNDYAKELERIYAGISAAAQQADTTLKASVEAELQKTLNGLKNLEAKMLKAVKQKNETSLNQLRKFKEKLFPSGHLQERYDNFIPFYLKYGRDFLSALEEHVEPLRPGFTIIKEG